MTDRLRVTIKEMPPDQRPRERLLAHGAAALSTVELVALLLGTGDRGSGASALELALRVLRFGARTDQAGIRFLTDMPVEALCRLPGIGPAKAARLLAAVELGRRALSERHTRPTVGTPADVAAILGEEMRWLRREHFRVVLLNTRHHVLAVETISIGGLDQASVHPREVFRAAIGRSAAAVILAHNHPSGDPQPSPDDLLVTRRLIEAGRLVGIEVLDHVVVGDGRHASIREQQPDWFESR